MTLRMRLLLGFLAAAFAASQVVAAVRIDAVRRDAQSETTVTLIGD
jgi:hypothetical protein